MGCDSSKEIDTSGPASRPQRPPAGQVPSQQYRDQNYQPLPPPPPPPWQFQGQRQAQQGAQQANAPSIPPPPQLRNSTSSAVQVLSAAGKWPKVVKLGTAPVTVSIHAHSFTRSPEPMPLWTYVSQGLSKVSQPEVVFTILRRPNEDIEAFPEGPLEWMQAVYALATGGMHLETGQMLELMFDPGGAVLAIDQITIVLDAKKWQTMRRFGSFVHGIPLKSGCFQLPGCRPPPDAHHVIALTHEETAVAKQFGVTRVIGHVGWSVRWFPYPPWIDRDRGDAVTMVDQGGSVRIMLPIARVYGLNAMLSEGDIVLTIPTGEVKRKAIKDCVLGSPMSAVVAFDSFMTEEADGGLVWKRGQGKPMAYTASGDSTKNLNLSFLAFAPQQDKDSCKMCEDGYTVFLREGSWKAFRDAVQNTQDLIIPLEDDMRFILQWQHSVFHNPIDGREYTASWHTYGSSHAHRSKQPANSHVDMSQVVLLIEPPAGSMDGKEFVNYIQGIVEIVEQQTTSTPLPTPTGSTHPGRQVVVEITLPKREGWLQATAYPSMDGLDIQGIMGRIGALRTLETGAMLKFQLYFDLWGYQGPATFS